jgi:hypothetical protein
MKANRIWCGSMVAAGIAAGLAVGPVFGATTTPPSAGLYSSYDYVASTSGTGCVYSKGDVFSGHLSWPGAGKTGAVWRYQLNPLEGTTGPVVQTITLPKTPAASSTSWTGTESHTFAPPSFVGPYTVFTGTFEGTLTYINSASFVLERSTTAGKCTTEIYSAFVAE